MFSIIYNETCKYEYFMDFVCTWMPNEEVLGMVYCIIMYIINFGAFVKLFVGIIVVVV